MPLSLSAPGRTTRVRLAAPLAVCLLLLLLSAPMLVTAKHLSSLHDQQYFFDPSYEYVTTIFCDRADDLRQTWTINTTSQMIHLASDPSRCLSLVPNAADINIAAACHESLVEDGILVDGVLRQAYDFSNIFSNYCSEFIQTIGRWHGRQFNDFSNVVTSQDCHAHQEQPHWIVDNSTGTIVNQESGACLQLGGELKEQVKKVTLFSFECVIDRLVKKLKLD